MTPPPTTTAVAAALSPSAAATALQSAKNGAANNSTTTTTATASGHSNPNPSSIVAALAESAKPTSPRTSFLADPSSLSSSSSSSSLSPSPSLSASSWWSHVEPAPVDHIFELFHQFLADPSPEKVNVTIGAYRDENGKPWVLPSVRKAITDIASDPSYNHEYGPIEGDPAFCDAAGKLLLGADSHCVREKRFLGVQTVSGTGAVRLGADFLRRVLPSHTRVYISDPTWGNHSSIFTAVGFQVETYAYWNAETCSLDFDAMIRSFKQAPAGSIFVLHACAHNPTGIDPTREQWRQLADVIADKKHFPFFDCAYQGFATGSVDDDAWAVRYFVDRGFEVVVAQSFSKNFGLYSQRAGCLTIVTRTPTQNAAVKSQLASIVRASYSNPPAFGASVVSRILGDAQRRAQWERDIQTMATRIRHMRSRLFHILAHELKTPPNRGGKGPAVALGSGSASASGAAWKHVTDQIGMFSYTGLSTRQAAVLRRDFHVYMTDSGRVSVAGLNEGNVRRFAEAVDHVVRHVRD